MSNPNYAIFWTTNAKLDLKDIYLSLEQNISLLVATKITDEIFESLNSIFFLINYKLMNTELIAEESLSEITKYFTNFITIQFTLLEYSILFKTQ